MTWTGTETSGRRILGTSHKAIDGVSRVRLRRLNKRFSDAPGPFERRVSEERKSVKVSNRVSNVAILREPLTYLSGRREDEREHTQTSGNTHRRTEC
jgi:hypothetical protein